MENYFNEKKNQINLKCPQSARIHGNTIQQFFFHLSILIFVIRVLMNERGRTSYGCNSYFPPCTSYTKKKYFIQQLAIFFFYSQSSTIMMACASRRLRVKELNIKHKFFNSTLHILFCEKKRATRNDWHETQCLASE